MYPSEGLLQNQPTPLGQGSPPPWEGLVLPETPGLCPLLQCPQGGWEVSEKSGRQTERGLTRARPAHMGISQAACGEGVHLGPRLATGHSAGGTLRRRREGDVNGRGGGEKAAEDLLELGSEPPRGFSAQQPGAEHSLSPWEVSGFLCAQPAHTGPSPTPAPTTGAVRAAEADLTPPPPPPAASPATSHPPVPGDAPRLHEAGRVPAPLADRRVAAGAAPGACGLGLSVPRPGLAVLFPGLRRRKGTVHCEPRGSMAVRYPQHRRAP